MRVGIPEERRAKSEGREIFFLSLVLLVFTYSFPPPQASAQENNDYEQLIERNLELRGKLKAMEEKYTAIENERNVLILHVRNLQEEKRRLADSIGERGEEQIHYPELKAAFGEVGKELSITVQERDVLKKDILLLKKQKEAGEERIRTLESEKVDLAGELNTIKVLFKDAQDKSMAVLTGLETEKANLSEQINRIKEAFEKEKADILAQGQKAVGEAKAEGRKESAVALRDLEQEKERLAAQIKGAQEAFEREKKKTIQALKDKNEKLTGEIKVLKMAFEKEKQDLLAREKKAAQEAAKTLENVQGENKTLANEMKGMKTIFEKEKNDWRAEKEKQTQTMDEQREGFLREINEMKKAHEENQSVLGGQFQEAQEKSRQLEKEFAIKHAFYQAQEEQLKAEHQNLVAAYEGLKGDVRQLTQERQTLDERLQKMSQGKKAAEKKARQSQEKLKSVRADLKVKQKLLAKRNKVSSTEKRQWEKKIAGLTKGKKAVEKKRRDAPVAPQGTETKVKALADKQSLDIHYNLALAYHKTKMYKEEEQEYLKCLKIDPDDAYVHYNLAILYDDKFNDNAKAIRHYRKYLDLSPLGEDTENVKVWMLHAEQDFRLGKQLR